MELIQEMATHLPLLWWGGLAIIGLCVGSFLNVLIYRLPIMIDRAQQANRAEPSAFTSAEAEERPPSFDLLLPASRCPECGEPIKWQHNIPLFSWLYLRGNSHCCEKQISTGYPLTELAAMVIALLGGFLIPPGLSLLGVLIFSWLLLALAIIDGKTWLLPDALTYPLLWLGLLFNLKETFISLPDAVVGAVAGYCILWGFNFLTSRWLNKNCMGNGDFKLTAAIAAWCGWQCLPQLLLLAALSGIISILLLRLLSRRRFKTAIPFGPSLAIAGLLQISGLIAIQ